MRACKHMHMPPPCVPITFYAEMHTIAPDGLAPQHFWTGWMHMARKTPVSLRWHMALPCLVLVVLT